MLLVLVAAFFVADTAAKSYAQGQIRDRLVAALGVTSPADITVDLGSGSLLLQGLAGSIDSVHVRVPKLAAGGLVGAADIRATKVPLDSSKPLGTLHVVYSVPAAQLATLATKLSGFTVDSVTVKQPYLEAATSVTALGASVPVTVGLLPGTGAGTLTLDPSTIEVAGQTFTRDQLLANPVFGRFATGLLAQQSFCIAEDLPRALSVRGAAVDGTTLVVRFTADGTVLGGPDFSTKGSCS